MQEDVVLCCCWIVLCKAFGPVVAAVGTANLDPYIMSWDRLVMCSLHIQADADLEMRRIPCQGNVRHAIQAFPLESRAVETSRVETATGS